MEPLKLLKRAGAPKAFKDEAELWSVFCEYVQEEINDIKYYADKEMIKAGVKAGEVKDIERIVLLQDTTFCLFAGIERTTFYKYHSNPDHEFFNIATRIKTFIDDNQIKAMLHNKANIPVGMALNNLKQRQDITSNDQQVNTVIIFEGLE